MNGALIGTSSPVGMAVTTSVNNISGRNIRIANSALDNYYNRDMFFLIQFSQMDWCFIMMLVI
jgi:hypothetical protein